MQAWHYGLASPPLEYNHPDALDSSQASDSDSDCASSATLASTASSLSSTSASAASSSMWSAPSSQNSDFTSYSVTSCEFNYSGGSRDASQQKRLVTGKLFGESLQPELGFQQTQYPSSQAREAVPPELRKNPRRTSAACSSSRGCPPTLFRQVDRKVEFVDKLVGKETIQTHHLKCTHAQPPIQILPRTSWKPYGRLRRFRAAPTLAPARASCRSGSSSKRLCAVRARVTRRFRWDSTTSS